MEARFAAQTLSADFLALLSRGPPCSTAKCAGCKFPASDEEDRNEAGSKDPSKLEVWLLVQPSETAGPGRTDGSPSKELSGWPSRFLSPFSARPSSEVGWEGMHNGSWKGEMKIVSRLFSLVANRSMWGTSQKRNIWDRVPLRTVHSVWIVCPFLESESARTFSFPGTNLAVRDTWHFTHQPNRLVTMKDRVRDRAPLFRSGKQPLSCCLLTATHDCLKLPDERISELARLLGVLEHWCDIPSNEQTIGWKLKGRPYELPSPPDLHPWTEKSLEEDETVAPWQTGNPYSAIGRQPDWTKDPGKWDNPMTGLPETNGPWCTTVGDACGLCHPARVEQWTPFVLKENGSVVQTLIELLTFSESMFAVSWACLKTGLSVPSINWNKLPERKTSDWEAAPICPSLVQIPGSKPFSVVVLCDVDAFPYDGNVWSPLSLLWKMHKEPGRARTARLETGTFSP